MTEQEVLEKLKQSADKIEVPEGLKPEEIKRKLELGERTEKKNYIWLKWAAVAAVFAVCAGSVFVYRIDRPGGEKDTIDKSAAKDSPVGFMEEAEEEAAAYAEAAQEDGTEEDAGKENIVREAKRDAGELYTVAKDYGEIYDALEESDSLMRDMGMSNGADDVVAEGEAMDSASGAGSAGTGAIQSYDMDMKEAAKEEVGYSKTNLQTEGVDESDIIKTDGSYIYRVSGDSVLITDITGKEMKQAGTVEIGAENGTARIREMYVDGALLNLIVEKEETDLSSPQETSDTERQGYIEDVYYMDTKVTTELLTYDISDRSKPELTGSYLQDGFYNTSRKTADIVYLFTEEGVTRPQIPREYAVEDAGTWLPKAGGEAVAADCIYLPERGSQGLIVSSVDVRQPEEKIDSMMIINDYVNIYVGSTGIYLYGSDYASEQVNTHFAKFEYHDGILNAKGAGSVRGEITDTFAVNEYNGKLRVLTTDWSSGESENNLYLFDSSLKLTGTLTQLAKGEEIYSARFFGNTAYFVTYRNIDPLFAVDLSDEEEPKVLSELKITGFSEYLHFWGGDKLLGIGYETDEKTGERKGMKLTMFDISEPADLRVLGSAVIENADYSPALYNYKAVLADKEENLIGFATESYGKRGSENGYLIFAWEDGKFKNLLSESLDSERYTEDYRGLYAGDNFYIANEEGISSYDRTDGYKKIEQFE